MFTIAVVVNEAVTGRMFGVFDTEESAGTVKWHMQNSVRFASGHSLRVVPIPEGVVPAEIGSSAFAWL